jgi:hypothetical protein
MWQCNKKMRQKGAAPAPTRHGQGPPVAMNPQATQERMPRFALAMKACDALLRRKLAATNFAARQGRKLGKDSDERQHATGISV